MVHFYHEVVKIKRCKCSILNKYSLHLSVLVKHFTYKQNKWKKNTNFKSRVVLELFFCEQFRQHHTNTMLTSWDVGSKYPVSYLIILFTVPVIFISCFRVRLIDDRYQRDTKRPELPPNMLPLRLLLGIVLIKRTLQSDTIKIHHSPNTPDKWNTASLIYTPINPRYVLKVYRRTYGNELVLHRALGRFCRVWIVKEPLLLWCGTSREVSVL